MYRLLYREARHREKVEEYVNFTGFLSFYVDTLYFRRDESVISASYTLSALNLAFPLNFFSISSLSSRLPAFQLAKDVYTYTLRSRFISSPLVNVTKHTTFRVGGL